MKKLIVAISCMMMCLPTYSQEDQITTDIIKLQELNGSASAYNLVFDQLASQLKIVYTGISDSVWHEVKIKVFVPQQEVLKKILVPVYKKYFTHEEIKEIIRFYESPAGTKMALISTDMTIESMQVSQQWTMDIMQKMQQYLTDKGYAGPNPFQEK